VFFVPKYIAGIRTRDSGQMSMLLILLLRFDFICMLHRGKSIEISDFHDWYSLYLNYMFFYIIGHAVPSLRSCVYNYVDFVKLL
jgi:uncharacterized protein with PQ loop repeat